MKPDSESSKHVMWFAKNPPVLNKSNKLSTLKIYMAMNLPQVAKSNF